MMERIWGGENDGRMGVQGRMRVKGSRGGENEGMGEK